MTLHCIGCRGQIGPEEPMVVVVVDRPDRWTETLRVVARLDAAPGRWHWRCAPVSVRRYASVVAPV